MNVIQRRLVALAFTFAMVFSLFLVKPVRAENWWKSSRKTITDFYRFQSKSWAPLGLIKLSDVKEHTEALLVQAANDGIRYLGGSQQGPQRYMYSVVSGTTPLGQSIGLSPEESAKVLWRHLFYVGKMEIMDIEKFATQGVGFTTHLFPANLYVPTLTPENAAQFLVDRQLVYHFMP